MRRHHDHLLHNIEGGNKQTSFPLAVAIGIVAGSVLLGGLSGFMLSRAKAAPVQTMTGTTGQDTQQGVPSSAGIKNFTAFPDDAEGILKEGGLDDEGSFHLERPGGPSQYVYLTSSTIDLNLFLGKKVRVWGQTNNARKAGWLMDVGYLEVL